jgi:hypothetical protein
MRELTRGKCESGLGVCAAEAVDALLHDVLGQLAAMVGQLWA